MNAPRCRRATPPRRVRARGRLAGGRACLPHLSAFPLVWWLLLSGAAALEGARPRDAQAQTLDAFDATEGDAAAEDAEPLDLNRADEAQLLQLPGMDPALARAVLACRRAAHGFHALDELVECAGVPPARLAEWEPLLTLEPLPRRRAVAATLGWNERRPDGGDATEARPPADGWRRRDYRAGAQAAGLGVAFRARGQATLAARDAGPFGGAPDTLRTDPRARAFTLRACPTPALGLTLGDFAPQEGLGLLLGLTRRAPARGARAALVGDAARGAWAPWRADALDRAAPTPSGRFLRGGALRLGRRLEVAAFELHPGETLAPTQARPFPPPARGFAAGLQLGGRRGPLLAPRVVQLDGHRWLGGTLALPLRGGEYVLEGVRDPARRWRLGVAAWRALGRAGLLQFSHVDGARLFVNPLGADAARGLAAGDSLAGARNDNVAETALRLRLRATPRVTTTLEVRGGSDPATRLRAFDRAVGAARVRVEAATGRGWTLRGDLGLESRDAPGPSAAVAAPLRRPTLAFMAGWQRGRAHLRAGMSGRLDLDAPPGGGADAAHPAGVATTATLLELRGRWPLSRDVWLGGGIATFHLPAGALLSAYEERPVDLPASVTLRGVGQRAHVALSVDLPFGVFGLYGVRERKSGASNVFWGSALRVRLESVEGGKRI